MQQPGLTPDRRLSARYPRTYRSLSASPCDRQSLGRPGISPETSHITRTVPDVNESLRRHAIIIRVVTETGRRLTVALHGYGP
jgi:hypothetical protein